MMNRSQKQFRILSQKNKSGEVSVVLNRKTGFRSMSVSGKVKVPKAFTNDRILHTSIYHIGLKFLRSYPDLFVQRRDKSIITSSLVPFVNHQYRIVNYDFNYIIKDGGPDSETAIKKILANNNAINEKITACMKLALEQSCDP